MIPRRIAGAGFVFVLVSGVVLCAFGAASLALRRAPVERLHTETASALRADYSADPRGQLQPPLSSAIIADAARDARNDAAARTPTATAAGSDPATRATAGAADRARSTPPTPVHHIPPAHRPSRNAGATAGDARRARNGDRGSDGASR